MVILPRNTFVFPEKSKDREPGVENWRRNDGGRFLIFV